MASVLTDQVLRAKLIAPLATLSGAAQTLQFSTTSPFGQTGNARLSVPATGRVTGNLFRIRVQGVVTRVTTATFSLAVQLDGVTIGTLSGTTATGTVSFSYNSDVLFQNATTALSGRMGGWVGALNQPDTNIPVVAATDLSVEGHLVTLVYTNSVADAAGSLSVSEFSLEVL